MRIILALICFIAMFMHGFFGYYLYVRGESVFEPDNMIVAVQKKLQLILTNCLSSKKRVITSMILSSKSRLKIAAFYENLTTDLIKTEERTEQEGQ